MGPQCVREPNRLSQDFLFDAVFDDLTPQCEIFEHIAPEILDQVLEGDNAAFVVYGQTGTGKTHTMTGRSSTDEEFRGIVPRAIENIFRGRDAAPSGVQYRVLVSYLEV